MIELEPLRSVSDDEGELRVLRSASGDRPPPGARARVAAALGVSAALVASSTSVALAAAKSASAAGTGVATSAGAAAAGAGALTSAGIAGWAGTGAVIGVVASLAAQPLLQSSAPTPVRHSAPSFASARPTPRQASPVAAPPGVTVKTAPAPPGAVEPPRSNEDSATAAPAGATLLFAPATPAPSRPAAAPEPAPSSALAEEVRALDEVNRALERNDAGRALRALGRYRERFAHGALATEARVLRVKALLMSGNPAGAELEAAAIVRADPGGRYAERVRALLGESR
jgi:hypothetical protein